MRFALLGILSLLLIVAVACSEEEGSTPPPGEAPTATPTTPAEPASPTPGGAGEESSPTGIASIDSVIKAVLDGNVEGLEGRVVLQETTCVAEPAGLGGPPICEEGEAEGATVQVFPVAYCEGTFDRDPGRVLEQFADIARRLHSVVKAPGLPRSEPYWPVGDTFVNFAAEAQGQEVGIRLVLENEKIVLAFFGCYHPLEELVKHAGQPLEVIYLAAE